MSGGSSPLSSIFKRLPSFLRRRARPPELAALERDVARLEREFRAEVELAVEWEKKAMIAVKAGNDELAKQALSRKLDHEALALECEGTLTLRVRDLERLRAVVGAARAEAVLTPAAAFAHADPFRADDLASRRVDRDLDAALDLLKAKMGVIPTPRRDRSDDDDDLDGFAGALVAFAGKKKRWDEN